jgi:hypothetical protein
MGGYRIHLLTAHVDCRVGLLAGEHLELEIKQFSFNHVHLTLTVIR